MTERGEQRLLVQRRGLLAVTGAATALGVGGWWWLTRQPPDYDGASLSPPEAHQSVIDGALVLIDIRTPSEWEHTGVPKGAHPIDMRRDDFVAALQAVAGPDRAAPIALICARGVRSARLSLALSDAGFTRIIDVPEGMLGSRAGPGWLARGLPVQQMAEVTQ